MNFLHFKSRTITSAAFLLATTALASRVLGLFRDRILAGKFGAGDELDIYFAAFRIPDLLYNVVIAGAISSAFIPVFIGLYTKNKKEAWAAAGNFLNVALFALIALAALLALAAPVIIPFVAPGFGAEKIAETARMSQIMFLSPVFLGLSAIISGILHSFKRFFAYALAPVFYNLGIIFGAVVLADYVGIYGLAWGVVLGAFLHLAVQIPSAVFSGFSVRGVFDIRDKYLRKIFALMAPRAFGLAAFQINLWVITAIASTLAVGSVAVFNFANNLQYLPIGIIGISFATAAFPALSKSATREKRDKFVSQVSDSMRMILFFVLPLSVFIFVLRAHIVRIVLGTGEFGWVDTRLTAAVLGIFCFGIFAHSLIPLLSRAFYALQDTKTPVLINTVGVFMNIIFSIAFVFWAFQIPSFTGFVSDFLNLEGIDNISLLGLPLAFALAGVINFKILFYVFARHMGFKNWALLFWDFQKIFFASIVSGLAAYGTLFFVEPMIETDIALGLLSQAGIAALAGGVVYIAIMFILRSPELKLLTKYRKRGIMGVPKSVF